MVLERGEVAQTRRTERWDLLRLLTPNWQSRLPGLGYNGDNPDGYRTLAEVIDFIAQLRRCDLGPGTNPHDGCIGAQHGGGVPGAHRSRRLAVPGGRGRFRGMQHR